MADWLEGRVVRARAWNPTHFSLQIDCELQPFTAGQFVRVALDIEGERVARPYSCVNAPHQPGVEILFNLVPEGPLTNELANLQQGDRVWVGPSAKGVLTLSQVPEQARDLWMLATGTGIGPFLSILQTREPWERFDRIVLAYGLRETANITYGPLLQQLQQEHSHRLRLIPCVTAEPPADGYHGRITGALRSGQLELLAEREITPERSHFMLCGNQAMIKEATDLLGERGLRRHLRHDPGHISSEKYH